MNRGSKVPSKTFRSEVHQSKLYVIIADKAPGGRVLKIFHFSLLKEVCKEWNGKPDTKKNFDGFLNALVEINGLGVDDHDVSKNLYFIRL